MTEFILPRRGFFLFAAAAPFSVLAAAPPKKDPLRTWKCPETECGWIYDPAIGDPLGQVPPGIPFEDLSEDWMCPECGAPHYHWLP